MKLNPKILRPLTLGLFVGNLAAVFYIWSKVSGLDLQTGSVSDVITSIGALAGLLAFYLILVQLMLISRISWIEQAWGHDRLSHVHHLNGIVSWSILLAHPVLVTIGYSQTAQTHLLSQFWIFLIQYEDVLAALLAYVMFLTIGFVSLNLIRKKMRYEWWYFIHFTLYLAIILAFNHQLSNGHDLVLGWAPVYWQVLFYGVLATVLYYRFIKPIIGWRKYNFHITQIIPETHNVNSVIIEGSNIAKFKAKAGQFIIVRFLTKELWWEAHPFSLSEAPNGHRFRITVKEVGDFTKKISQLKPGTRILIEGPLGRFVPERNLEDKVLLIAGGIGITPLRSIFEEFSKTGTKVDLIYSASSERDFALKDELLSFTDQNTKIHLVPSDKDGHLTEEKIKSLVPDVAQRFVYLCGPKPMMMTIRKYLTSLGVSKSHILYERFVLG